MRVFLRVDGRWVAAATALVLCSSAATAQPGAALAGLAGAATDLNFYGQWVGARGKNIGPEHELGARGLGFEFAFALPGAALTRRKALDTVPDPKKPNSCLNKYLSVRKDATQVANFACSDTTWALAERRRQLSARDTTIRETIKDIRKFDVAAAKQGKDASALDTLFDVELAVGFSQAGAFVSRTTRDSLRVSLREIPSASIYATLRTEFPIAPYFGVRTGLLTLQSGRLYKGDTAVTKFGGETFQLGGVVGLVGEVFHVSVFVEGSWMRRAFDSVDWEGVPPQELRRLSFSGPAVAIGGQVHFRDHEGK